jgi:MoxR-like ATPase
MIKDTIGYPESDGLLTLLRRRSNRDTSAPTAGRVLEAGEVTDLQNVSETITADDDMLEYIAQVCLATQDDHRVRVGISPRGTQRLFEAARARAVVAGRDYITPDDVKQIARPVLAHRLVLTAEAQVNDVDKQAIVEDILGEIPVPTVAAEA